MTRIPKPKPSSAAKPAKSQPPRRRGRWALQDAKVRTQGPQHVTVHGRDEVVVLAAAEFRRLQGDLTGAALVAAMAASPYRETELAPKRSRLPVRAVRL
jgi:hypothetical protein